jgi:hypothetical protein
VENGQGTLASAAWEVLGEKRKRGDDEEEKEAKRVRGELRVVLEPKTRVR